MNSKLTLRLDENLITSAKKYSEKTGQSVSKLVANYFALIDVTISEKPQKTPKITRELSGFLKKSDKSISEDDYGKYLEDKYL